MTSSPDFNEQIHSLRSLSGGLTENNTEFDKDEHDSRSRLAITRLFLTWYFYLIIFGFLFSAGYNFIVAYLNQSIFSSDSGMPHIEYLDVTNTVSLITTTLSSGVGFVIGYYFKNKSN